VGNLLGARRRTDEGTDEDPSAWHAAAAAETSAPSVTEQEAVQQRLRGGIVVSCFVVDTRAARVVHRVPPAAAALVVLT
jgi:hypothetical protein